MSYLMPPRIYRVTHHYIVAPGTAQVSMAVPAPGANKAIRLSGVNVSLRQDTNSITILRIIVGDASGQRWNTFILSPQIMSHDNIWYPYPGLQANVNSEIDLIIVNYGQSEYNMESAIYYYIDSIS